MAQKCPPAAGFAAARPAFLVWKVYCCKIKEKTRALFPAPGFFLFLVESKGESEYNEKQKHGVGALPGTL